MLRLVLLFCLLGPPALAQVRDATPVPGWQAERWAAVGRVTRGADADSTCTGVLIAPTRVLTVAHCVGDLTDPDALAGSDLVFRAGALGDGDVDRAQVTLVETHPNRNPVVFNTQTIPYDLAVLTLERPLTVAPLPFGEAPRAEEPLVIISYRNIDLSRPYMMDRCQMEARTTGLARIGCSVIGGNSGSPLLARREGRFEIVGIMSARLGPQASYAILLTTWPVDAISSE